MTGPTAPLECRGIPEFGRTRKEASIASGTETEETEGDATHGGAGVSAGERRSTEGVVLPVWLAEDRRTVEVADGEVIGTGYVPYLDPEGKVTLFEDSRSPVLPGVFCTRLTGVSFHDDVVQLAHFRAGSSVEVRPEPANASDRNPLAIFGGGHRVGYVPAPIATTLAPSGTRVGRGIVLMEWSSNGRRDGLSVLGSMHVTLQVSLLA